MIEPSILHPERFGGAKFVLCIGCGFVNACLLVYGAITPSVYEFLTIGTVGAYITGEAVSSATAVFQKPKVNKETE